MALVVGGALMPLSALAHQHAILLIGGDVYEFTIGSLNEPIAVDDKTGVDLRVQSQGAPVTGLEQTLQVELMAGDERKVLDLSPVFNTPGSYSAAFYPTEAVPLSYRFFGTVNDTPVDLTFTCREEGTVAAEEGERAISENVTQLEKGGGFGCPAEKEDLGFPKPSAAVAAVRGDAQSASTWGFVGTGLGVLALGVALLRRRS